jgi:hypothetical protein
VPAGGGRGGLLGGAADRGDDASVGVDPVQKEISAVRKGERSERVRGWVRYAVGAGYVGTILKMEKNLQNVCCQKLRIAVACGGTGQHC